MTRMALLCKNYYSLRLAVLRRFLLSVYGGSRVVNEGRIRFLAGLRRGGAHKIQ